MGEEETYIKWEEKKRREYIYIKKASWDINTVFDEKSPVKWVSLVFPRELIDDQCFHCHFLVMCVSEHVEPPHDEDHRILLDFLVSIFRKHYRQDQCFNWN